MFTPIPAVALPCAGLAVYSVAEGVRRDRHSHDQNAVTKAIDSLRNLAELPFGAGNYLDAMHWDKCSDDQIVQHILNAPTQKAIRNIHRWGKMRPITQVTAAAARLVCK